MIRIPRILIPLAAAALVGGCGKIKDAGQAIKNAIAKPKDGQSQTGPASPPAAPPAPTGGAGPRTPPTGITAAASVFPGGEVYPADAAKLDLAMQEISRVVVVDFYADWCGPCKRMAPIMDQLAREYSKDVVFLKVNTDQQKDLAGRHNVTSIPDVRLFLGGKAVDRWTGWGDDLVNKEKAKSIIDKALASRTPPRPTGPLNTGPPIETTLSARPATPATTPAPAGKGEPAKPAAPPIQERKSGEEHLPAGMRKY